jgi:hypothetical protein
VDQPRCRRVVISEDVGVTCYQLLKGVQAYLNTILGLFDSGEFQIRQLSADDSEIGEEGE